jgi:hypothetical protein
VPFSILGAVMPPSRASTLIRFLTTRLAFTVDELVALRDEIDAHIRKRVAILGDTAPRKTLYLPSDSLDDL